MKALLAATLVFSFSTLASANLVFLENSKVPTEIQDKIVSEISARCPKLDTYGLREVSTTERVDRIDQGVIDRFYTTVFKGSYYFDGSHPISTYIEVKSELISGYNPNGPGEVVSISADEGVCL